MGNRFVSTSRAREAGLRQGLESHGLVLQPDLVVHGGFGHDDGADGFEYLMTRPKPPTAVFCIGDAAAVGALNRAVHLGIRVPEQVSVVGFDNLPIAGWPTFNLTTIDAHLPRLADAAATKLTRVLAGDPPSAPAVTTVPTDLVVRSTHGPAPR